MLSSPWTIGLIAVLVLAGSAPYVARIRHADQRPFAAYLLFVSVFLTAAAVLFGLLTWLVGALDLTPRLADPLIAILYLAVIFGPALLLASWQARQPPLKRQPPA